MIVSTSTVAGNLKETLEEIVDDDTDGSASDLPVFKLFEEGNMADQFVDDLEYGGPGLAVEKPEAVETQAGTIKEGYLTRYMARTFGLKLIISDEAIEDSKYDKVINAAKRLKRAMVKTVEIDATNVFVRMFNSSYVGGDSVSLGSASHTLPQGGTFSNQMAVPMAPSVAAVIVATTQIMKYPGHDGIVEGYSGQCVGCPVDQWAAWKVILNSTHKPEAGEFNAINVANGLGLDVYPLKQWTNSTTNWFIRTDVDNGLKWLWRRQPKGRAWVDNDHEVKKFSISARWARGWSDPRCVLAVNA